MATYLFSGLRFYYLCFLLTWGAVGQILLPGLPAKSTGGGPQVQLDLLTELSATPPGGSNSLALRMRIAEDWHIYWRQPSDSGDIGEAPTVRWKLPAGVMIGEFNWPVPERKFDTNLNDTYYVYHELAVLLAPVSVAAGVAPGTVMVEAEVKWQECTATQCVRRVKTLRLPLEIGQKAQAVSDPNGIVATARSRLPRLANFPITATWMDAETNVARRLEVTFANPNGRADFYPFANPTLSWGEAGASRVTHVGERAAIVKAARKIKDTWPDLVSGLAVRLDDDGHPREAWTVTTTIGAPPPSVGLGKGAPAASFWAMLGAAFLGGLILNVMPCVLPVIALKILGFVRQSQESPGRVRQLGLAYGFGVLVSFLGLAGMVLIAQAATGRASWGMQFQDARFLVIMTTLVTLVALNLFGVFEIHLGSRAMTAASSAARQEGLGGAFANGVLATVLATPCTAPFLGPALGYAISQKSTALIVLFFLMIGLGLAAPYVVLCWHPAWLKKMPKPGAWMEKFKIAMGFPMMATAVWLLSLATLHFGEDALLWLGVFLVLVAMGAWIFGEFIQRGSSRRWLAWGALVGVLGIAYVYPLEQQLEWRMPSTGVTLGGKVIRRKSGLAWEPWSAEGVAAARAEGRAVLVDFTAKTCLICQVNEKVAIEVPVVADRIRAERVALFKADTTFENPVVLAELERHNRSSVPLVLVYSPKPGVEPQVLPSILTPGIVLEALDQARR